MIKRLFYIILQRLYVFSNRKKVNQGKVYMFHNISNDADDYSLSENHFLEMLDFLMKNKKIVDVETMMKELNENNVVITFDDAYDSVYHIAYPLLKKYNVPYYIFICNEYLHKDKYLTEAHIEEMLKNSKCILGSHNYFHELSRFLDLDTFKHNIISSKEELELKFNVDVEDFAFPYGSIYAVSSDNIYEAKKIFKHVYLTYALPYNKDYDDEIPRININDSNYERELR